MSTDINSVRSGRKETSAAKCFACGGARIVRDVSEHSPRLQRCDSCGLRFSDPQPTEPELAEIYSADYYAGFGSDDSVRDSYSRMMRCRARKLLEKMESIFTPSRLLDVGSGLGDLVAVAGERGWDARGVERNRHAVELSPGKVDCCAIEDFEDVGGQTFDLITCLDVLEHLRRPDRVLRKLHGLLRIGGGLVLTTPDVGSLAARLMGARWPHYHRDHLWYFNRQSLMAVVERAGFEILECSRAKKAFTLHYLLSILSQPQQAPAIRWPAAVALKLVPGWIARRMFTLREGLFLMARK